MSCMMGLLTVRRRPWGKEGAAGKLERLGFHLAGARLAGYEAGSEDHGDEGQSDEQIVHFVSPVSGAFTAALLTLIESRLYGFPTIPLPLRFKGLVWERGVPLSGDFLRTRQNGLARAHEAILLAV